MRKQKVFTIFNDDNTVYGYLFDMTNKDAEKIVKKINKVTKEYHCYMDGYFKMRLSDTDKLQAEYVEIYNKYMTLPDDSKELKSLTKKLQDLEQTLTRRFLFESGYDLQKSGEVSIYIKDGQ